MATSAQPVREAAPANGTPAPAPGAGQPAAPSASPLEAAFEAARELVRQREAGGATATDGADGAETRTAPAPGTVADGATGVVDGDEAPIDAGDGTVGDGQDGIEGSPTPAKPDLTVMLDGAREGEQVAIEVDSVETADRIRQLQRAALRGNQARQMREQAEALRNEAEEFRYTVEADPAGVIAEIITQPQDQEHLARFLLTRPGVLEQVRPWLENILGADPSYIDEQAQLAHAARINRRDKIAGAIEEKRALNKNASQLVARTERAIDTMVPEGWTDEQKGLLYRDILSDIRETARQENVRMLDPRRVDQMVQRRLKLLGVAPRAAQSVGTGAPPAGQTPAVTKRPTPETLRAARGARAAAASAPVGAGSPAASIPKPPPYDPTKKGSAIQQAAAFARSMVSAMKKPS